MSEANPFSPEVVEAVKAHMNEDHREDSLRLCQALGGRPDATSALMVGMDADGIDFRIETPDGPAEARVLWGERVTERPQVRTAVVHLHDEACHVLGIPVPDRGEH